MKTLFEPVLFQPAVCGVPLRDRLVRPQEARYVRAPMFGRTCVGQLNIDGERQ